MNQFLALTSFGIEGLLAQEVTQLGATDVVQKPEGVYFKAELKTAYHICLWTRLATRVLLQLDKQPAANKEELYLAAKNINWPDIFDCNNSFAVDFVGKSQTIRDSQFGGLTVKDAIVDCFREQKLLRPSVDKHSPEIMFQARLLKNEVAIYLDFSGRGLFQRGYREKTGAAPLKENLAAALLIRSGWLDDTSKPLVDPMCGSGTLLTEAIGMAAKQSPSMDRVFWGFEFWLNHQADVFEKELVEARQTSEQNMQAFKGKVFGFDLDEKVLRTTRTNIKNSGFGAFIEVSHQEAKSLKNSFGSQGVILFNPPYGERIGSIPELVETFTQLGNIFKQEFVHWRVAVLTANPDILALLKLASHKRYKFKNGPLDCQLALYNLDEAQVAQSATQINDVDPNSDFANRLKKNVKSLKGWLKSSQVQCYRVYDADIPEYNVAVDVYGDYLVIQEYAAPSYMDESKTTKRLQEVIYSAPKILNISSDKVSLKVRSKQKGSKQYQKLDQSKQAFVIDEYGAKLKVNIWDYLDTGLFLDHRKTRQIVAKKAKGKSLLNLFAYTGSVSLQAALHGAESVTTVDMSKTYLDWAQENFDLNKLSGHKYQFIQANCLEWLEKNTTQYDVVFIDPPTFSNSKRMENSFDVQRDHLKLLELGAKSLTDSGEMIFTNNKRNFKMDFDGLTNLGLTAENISELTRDKDFQRNKHIHNSWVIRKQHD